MMLTKLNYFRSEKHRKNVASLPCIACGIEGSTQAAHRNFGKGFSLKSCDSQMMPLCFSCHSEIDQGGNLDRDTRRTIELAFVKATRQVLINRNQWSPEVEAAYQKIHNISQAG